MTGRRGRKFLRDLYPPVITTRVVSAEEEKNRETTRKVVNPKNKEFLI
jgi:hypothetical protein